MFGGSGKKAFVRTRISPTERFFSWFILGLIGAVGVVVYLKGQRYDPGLFALDATHLSTERISRSQVELPVEISAEKSGDRPGGRSTDLLDGLSPEGWQLTGPIERFTASNLYEKINGRAEQYLAYDVVGLTYASFTEPEGRFVDVFLYDMGQPLNAFGIYSVERAPEVLEVELGRQGYRSEASFFFWKGRCYVQILASEREEAMRRTAEEIARTLDRRLEESVEEIWGLAVLPEADRVPGSVQYFKRDALSLDFLTNVFTATYSLEGGEVTVFLSQQESPRAASEVLNAYQAYLENYGQIVERKTAGGSERIMGDMGGFFDVVFQHGKIIAGVSMAEDPSLATQAALKLLHALEGR